MSTILAALHWRYATKQFDPTKKLTAEQFTTLVEALQLSPSSYGLQPWKFIVVTNPGLRQQLRAAAGNQSQVTDASHLIVLTVKKNIDTALADEHLHNIAITRGLPVESLQSYRDRIMKSWQNQTPEELRAWASRQVYIALGTLLTTAALEQIDACPMEGFDHAQCDAILELDKLGVQSVVLAAVGFRSSQDSYAQAAKVRYTKEAVVVEIK